MRSILIIRLSSLGDIILTSPAVVNLRLRYPGARIDYLTKPSFAKIAQAIPGVDRTLALPPEAGLAELVRFSGELEDESYDLVVDLHNNLRSRLLRRLCGAGSVISVQKRRLQRELIARFQRTNAPVPHITRSYNQTLRQTDCNIPLASTLPRLNDTFGNLQDDGLLSEWKRAGNTIVAFAPGARSQTKRAPLELFRETLRALRSDPNIYALNLYRSDEGKLSLNSEFPAERYYEMIDASLERVAAALRTATVSLTNDSGMAHLSTAVGTPVVALFGPTHPALGFAPAGINDTVIDVNEPCRPCSLHGSRPCHRSERFCFSNISADRVITKLNDILALQESARAALFLDRDGTVIQERGFLSDPAQVEILPGTLESLRQAKDAGMALVLISNQSGVARGMFTEEDVRAVNSRVERLLRDGGVELDASFYSPTHPAALMERYRTPDGGRKPSDELFIQAAREHNLDLRKSWIIGDRPSDFLSSQTFGGRGALVRTGYGAEWAPNLAQFGLFQPRIVADNLSEAISVILRERG